MKIIKYKNGGINIMGLKRNEYDESFKLKIVLMLLKNEASQSEIARKYNVTPAMMIRWRDRFLESGKKGLSKSRSGENNTEVHRLKNEIQELHRVIGEITIANTALKKTSEMIF